MTADPMLSAAGVSGQDAVLPKSEEKETVELGGAPELDKATQATNLKQDPTSADLKPVESEQSEQIKPEPDAPVEPGDPLSDTSVQAPEQTDTVSSEIPETDPDDSDTSEVEPDVTGNPLQAQKSQSSEELALKAREEEIEHHIAAGTYAVPINTVKRRRMQIVISVFAVLLVILIALDLCADMNVITLPFGLPHTNFFTS